MRRFILKEQLRLVQEGCLERLEGEVGGPFHVPISMIKSLSQQNFTHRSAHSHPTTAPNPATHSPAREAHPCISKVHFELLEFHAAALAPLGVLALVL